MFIIQENDHFFWYLTKANQINNQKVQQSQLSEEEAEHFTVYIA